MIFNNRVRSYNYERHLPGQMNKLEKNYAQKLEFQKSKGMIHDFWFEVVKFKIGKPACWYNVDFLVITKEFYFEAHEVKGRWEDDAKVKIKSAAHQYPWIKFIAIQKAPNKLGGGWKYINFSD